MTALTMGLGQERANEQKEGANSDEQEWLE